MLLLLAACAPEPEPAERPPPATGVDCEALSLREDGATTFYESNPTYLDPDDRLGPYPVVEPAQVDLDPALLAQGTAALEAEPFVQSLLVFRDGALAWEAYLHGTGPQDSHNVHSASKSILAAAVGVAVSQGLLSLDEPVADHLPAFGDQEDPRKGLITLRHLLTMTSGLSWVEDRSEYRLDDEPDWVQAIAELPMEAAPGERFNYSTANTHLLSAVLQEATGASTCDFVHEVLFQPLDIAAEHWGRDPQGVSSGGYNVYLTPRELARFGLLVADQGRWNGEQLLSSDWVDEMMAPHQRDGAYRYGYLWWMRSIDEHEVWIAWGYGGQFVYLVESLGLVIVITTDTALHDPYWFDAEQVLREHLLPAAQ